MQTVFKKGEPCPMPTTPNDALFVDNYTKGTGTLIYRWDSERVWLLDAFALCIGPKEPLPMDAELLINYFEQD